VLLDQIGLEVVVKFPYVFNIPINAVLESALHPTHVIVLELVLMVQTVQTQFVKLHVNTEFVVLLTLVNVVELAMLETIVRFHNVMSLLDVDLAIVLHLKYAIVMELDGLEPTAPPQFVNHFVRTEEFVSDRTPATAKELATLLRFVM